MTRPDTAQPDDEQPVTATPAERTGDDAESDTDTDGFALGQDDDLRAGQIGPDDTRP